MVQKINSFPVAIDLHIQSIDLLNKGIDPNAKKQKETNFMVL